MDSVAQQCEYQGLSLLKVYVWPQIFDCYETFVFRLELKNACSLKVTVCPLELNHSNRTWTQPPPMQALFSDGPLNCPIRCGSEEPITDPASLRCLWGGREPLKAIVTVNGEEGSHRPPDQDMGREAVVVSRVSKAIKRPSDRLYKWMGQREERSQTCLSGLKLQDQLFMR